MLFDFNCVPSRKSKELGVLPVVVVLGKLQLFIFLVFKVTISTVKTLGSYQVCVFFLPGWVEGWHNVWRVDPENLSPKTLVQFS